MCPVCTETKNDRYRFLPWRFSANPLKEINHFNERRLNSGPVKNVFRQYYPAGDRTIHFHLKIRLTKCLLEHHKCIRPSLWHWMLGKKIRLINQRCERASELIRLVTRYVHCFARQIILSRPLSVYPVQGRLSWLDGTVDPRACQTRACGSQTQHVVVMEPAVFPPMV